MRLLFLRIQLALVAIPFALLAQSGTEIFLFKIEKITEGFELKNSQNITDRIGYDNQPFFHPSLPLIYYTAQADNQTDIWTYNYQTKKTNQLTKTEDSEYSPTLTPDHKHITCIVQRKSNGDQDLVKFNLKQITQPEILLESSKTGKIGYHAWNPKGQLVAFVLGEPNTLQSFDVKNQKGTMIAQNIGRSLHYLKGKKVFSYVDNEGKIKLYDPENQQIKVYASGLPDSDNYNSWNKNGVLFATKNEEIYFFDEKSNSWKTVNVPTDIPKNKISRIAIKDNLMAVVINE